jgi:hypothetical protein
MNYLKRLSGLPSFLSLLPLPIRLGFSPRFIASLCRRVGTRSGGFLVAIPDAYFLDAPLRLHIFPTVQFPLPLVCSLKHRRTAFAIIILTNKL